MRMTRSIARRLDELRVLVQRFTDGSAMRRLQERLLQRQQRIDELTTRYARSVSASIDRLRQRVVHQESLMTSLHPLAPLRRGFAVVERDGSVLPPGEALHQGDRVTIRRQSQTADVTVTDIQDVEQPEGSSDE
jgi:exodeoxyribonuclease VII large subunit